MKLDATCEKLLQLLDTAYLNCETAADVTKYQECLAAVEDAIRRLTGTKGYAYFCLDSGIHRYDV